MTTLRLGDVTVDPLRRQIHRSKEEPTRVDFKAMEVLLRLASAPNRVVTKEALLDSVWSGRYVGEAVLPVAISTLRRALGDDAASPRFIETIPRVGYRLVAPVEPLPASSATARRTKRLRPVLGAFLALALVAVVAASLHWTDGPASNPVVVEVRSIEVEAEAVEFRPVAERIRERLIYTLSREPSTLARETVSGPSSERLYVVGGTLRRQGERLSFSAHLIAQPSGDIEWAPVFEVASAKADLLPEQVQHAFRRGALPVLRR